MIKLSTKGRYGTRLMVNLARHYKNSNEPTILKNVSEEEGISIRYLEQIIIPLKINRLVKSIRGAGGGYILARKPTEIKICDILHALEGSCSLVECIEDETFCEKIKTCGTYEIWKGATELLRNYFEKLTLQDALEICEKKISAAKKRPKIK
ncbi:MAG: Rrf2 family transcriptional regulator [Candidatus Aminicenantes bacterium]|jgi:Rrf2 family protein|nr:Rrf2 family transcriptional regulator [Candidatus Aminicenantes bacterium]